MTAAFTIFFGAGAMRVLEWSGCTRLATLGGKHTLDSTKYWAIITKVTVWDQSEARASGNRPDPEEPLYEYGLYYLEICRRYGHSWTFRRQLVSGSLTKIVFFFYFTMVGSQRLTFERRE